MSNEPAREKVSFYLDRLGRRLQMEFRTSPSGYEQEANAGWAFECNLVRFKYWITIERFRARVKNYVIVSAVNKPVISFKASVEDFPAGLNNWLEQGYQDLKAALTKTYLSPGEGHPIVQVPIHIPYEESSGNRTNVTV